MNFKMKKFEKKLNRLRQEVAELNKHVGSPEVDIYLKKVHLPKGYHLDFGMNSNKYVMVDSYGARVF